MWSRQIVVKIAVDWSKVKANERSKSPRSQTLVKSRSHAAVVKSWRSNLVDKSSGQIGGHLSVAHAGVEGPGRPVGLLHQQQHLPETPPAFDHFDLTAMI